MLRFWVAFQLTILVAFGVYAASPVITSSDSIWTVYTAMSIVKEHDFDLDEYLPLLQDSNFHATRKVGAHFYEYFPYGTAMLAVPMVWMFDRLEMRTVQVDIGTRFREIRPSGLEQLLASLFAALAVGATFATARLRVADIRVAVLAALVLGLATSAWSTASRALWQQGPSMLMIALALLLAVAAARDARWIWLLGPVLAAAYIVRPTNSLAVVVLTGWVAITHRRQLLPYLAGMALLFSGFVAINLRTFGAWLPEYYSASRIADNPRFLEALAGNLISPGRGLFVFSPVLIFALVAVVRRLRTRRISALEVALGVLVLLHWIAVSSFAHWWGGHSFGPRFFTDLGPIFVYLMLPYLKQIVQEPRTRRSFSALTFLCLLSISLFAHMRGATAQATWLWNSEPVGIDSAPERLWNWRDIQFLRGLRPPE